MKKYCHLLFLVALLFSCKREVNPQLVSNTCITADFAEVNSSKTVLSDNTISVLWCPGDQIAVFYGKCKGMFTAQTPEPSPKTVFSTDKSWFFAGFEGDNDYLWGVYPYSDNTIFKDNSVDMELSSVVEAVPGSFAPGSFPSIGRSSDIHKVSFYNICSGFAITLYRDNIQSITVSAPDNAPLAGIFNVTFDGSIPVVSKVYDTFSSSVSLSAKDGFLSSGVVYYIPVLPSHISQGIRITYKTQSTQCDTLLAGDRDLRRNKFITLSKLDSALVFKVSTQSVTLDRHDVVLSTNGSINLQATVLPADASDKTIIWSSSDASVASVDDNGLITAKDVSGSCTVYARSRQNESICDSCSVIVNKHVIKVSIDTGAVNVYKDSTYRLRAIVLPEGVTDSAVLWSSSDNSIASVDSTGLITAKSKGDCLIIATSHDNQDIRDTCYVHIVQNVSSISFQQESKMIYMDETFQIVLSILPDDAFDKSVVWESDDESVATVSDLGLVTPVAGGKCKITAKSSTNPGAFATCEVTVKEGVNLSQKGTANCYIVSAPGTYKFNANAKGVSGTSLGTVASVNILWEYKNCNSTIKAGEIIKDATLHNNFAYFDVPDPMTNGNALIVARSSDGTILWSWHIWAVRDYDPITTAQTYKNKAGVFMDRNLGMVNNVKGEQSCVSYQWGRKDPFPVFIALQITGVTTLGRQWPAAVKSTEATGTIAYSIENPTTFLLQNDNNSDWLYTTDDGRWGSKKTDYDPCPVGWKVPEGGDDGPWKIASGQTSVETGSTKWDTSQKSLSMKTILTANTVDCWYPACGYLSGTSFACMNQGINVGQWSATHYKTAKQSKAYDFFSTSKTDNTSTSHTSACATGYQVRCVKESK